MRTVSCLLIALAGCGTEPAGVEPPAPTAPPAPPAPTVPSEPPSNAYTSDWSGMLTFFHNRCISCHQPDGTASPILGFEVLSVVVPFDPEASVLWRVVSGDVAAGEDTMPFGQEVLPPSETAHVREWIALGAVVGPEDVDGDGWLVPEDCDDNDPWVFPFTEPQVLLFTDVDGDGFGVEPQVLACLGTPGTTEVDGDCDDGDPTAYPAAAEGCTDPVDRNCDGTPGFVDADLDGLAACEECDDGDPAAGLAPTWYPDADEDGAGVAAGAVVACDAPPDTAASPDDCDDANPSVNPSAPEQCNTRDDDCDGDVDESDAVDPAAWYLDGDGDGFGAGPAVVSCDAPADFVALSGDCDDTSALFAPGAPETCLDVSDFNCDGAVGSIDGDGDGFAACDECDDLDPNISPGGVEVCNGVDDDCDGAVDVAAVDAGVWFGDGDGDGFGLDAGAVVACVAPPLHAALGGDCDDAAPAVRPDAAEVCNGTDDNCDGSTDGLDAVDPPPWFFDADLDGFGGDTVVFQCDAPLGSVAEGGDCDDGDVTFYPGAPEACTEPLDRDCDGEPGLVDEDLDGLAACEECDDLDLAVGLATDWYPDGDGDGFGVDAGAVAACDAPLGFADRSGDCSDGEQYVNPDAAFDPIDGRDNDCDGLFDEDGALSHALDIQPIWDATCTSTCHELPGPTGGLNLSAPAYARIVGVPSFDVPAMDSVAPFSPDDSYLWHKLQDTQLSVGGAGVLMPKLDTLTLDELALIEAWIVAGAPP